MFSPHHHTHHTTHVHTTRSLLSTPKTFTALLQSLARARTSKSADAKTHAKKSIAHVHTHAHSAVGVELDAYVSTHSGALSSEEVREIGSCGGKGSPAAGKEGNGAKSKMRLPPRAKLDKV